MDTGHCSGLSKGRPFLSSLESKAAQNKTSLREHIIQLSSSTTVFTSYNGPRFELQDPPDFDGGSDMMVPCGFYRFHETTGHKSSCGFLAGLELSSV